MSSVESITREIVARIQSTKVIEKRKAVVELRELLHRSEITRAVNELSDRDADSTLSWNELFVLSHEAILQEFDRKTTSGNIETRLLPCTSLMQTIVNKANSDTLFLDHIKIIDAAVYVLETPVYRDNFGQIYLDILHYNLLSVLKYWGRITIEQWRDLFELTKKLYIEPPAKYSKPCSHFIEMLSLIVKNGCEHTSFAVYVRKQKIFDLVQSVIDKAVENKEPNLQFHAIKFAVVVCKSLQRECRTAICRFGEKIVKKLLSLHEPKVERAYQKTEMIVEFLLIIIEAHHPNGVGENSDESYAFDWNNWKMTLKRLSCVINKEIPMLRKYDEKKRLLFRNLIKLIVEIYNQIFRFDSHSLDISLNLTGNDTFDSNPNKRRRLTNGFSDLIDQLDECTRPLDMCPWLEVLSSLISTYPSLVNSTDYMLLLKRMSKFLSISKEPTATDNICRCCVALIGVKKSNNYKQHLPDEKTTWNSIWNALLRTIGLNQNVEWSHRLLRTVISDMWKPEETMAVLKLYLSQVVRLNEYSLQTLFFLREHTSFPNSILDVPVCSSLLRWLIPKNEFSSNLFELPVQLLAHTIFVVCLKNKIKFTCPNSEPLNVESMIVEENRIPTAQIYALSSYKSSSLFRSDAGERENGATINKDNENETHVLNKDAWEQFVNLLEDSFQYHIDDCNQNDDKLVSYKRLRFCLELVLNTLEFEQFYRCRANVDRLVKLRDILLKEFRAALNNVLSSGANFKKLITALKELRSFFEQIATFSVNVTGNILQLFVDELHRIFELFQNASDIVRKKDEEAIGIEIDRPSVFDTQVLSFADQLSVEACKVLLYCSYNSEVIGEEQKVVLRNLIEVLGIKNETEKRTNAFLQMVVYTIIVVFKTRKPETDIFVECTYLIKTLCEIDAWTKMKESSVVILKLIRLGMENVAVDNVEGYKNLQILLNGMSMLLINPDPGSTVQIIRAEMAFMKITNLDNIRYKLENFSETLSVFSRKIFEYLQHPSHEIRITAVSFLTQVFGILDHYTALEVFTNIHNEDIVDTFYRALFDLFTVDEMATECEHDEKINRPLTVLYSIMSVICVSASMRRKTIYTFFLIIREKCINQELAMKILETVSVTLKVKNVVAIVKDNFLYVGCRWFEKYGSFEHFPFKTIGFASLNEFYQEFLVFIVVVALFYGAVDELTSISTAVGRDFKTLYKNLFSDVIAVTLIKMTKIEQVPPINDEGATANRVYKLIENAIGQESINTLMLKRLPRVVVSVLRRLHDNGFDVPKHCILPPACVLSVNAKLIEDTIMFLKTSAGIDKSSLFVYTAEHHPKFIQEIFMLLYVDVMNGSTPEVKLECFQRYALFCEFLLPFGEHLNNYEMIIFVTKTMLFNLLNFISNDERHSQLSLSALNFIRHFVHEWMPIEENSWSSKVTLVVKKYLNIVVEKLVALACKRNELGEISLEILNELLIERCQTLFVSIEELDRFPPLPQFDNFRDSYLQVQETQTDDVSLRKDIEQFLKAMDNSSNCSYRVENLKYFRKQLSSYEMELRSIFDQLASKSWFSECCVNEIPHRIILTLLKCVNDGDEQIAQEAVACLGVIGLVDLHTLVLQPSEDVREFEQNPELLIIENACKMLKDYILDENTNVVTVSSAILYDTLLTKSGYSIVEGLGEFERSLIFPFLPSAENVDKQDVSQLFMKEKFREKLNDESLWLPLEEITYEEWIMNLVHTIVECFSKKSYLSLMKRICKLKPSFSENIFKYLVHLLLNCDSCEPKQILSQKMNQFFECFFKSQHADPFSDSYSSNGDFPKCREAIFLNKTSIRCLLDVVHFVRLNQEYYHKNDLNINYLYTAKAAQYCSAYFTSILYAEVWINSQIMCRTDVDYNGNITSFLEQIGNVCVEDQNEVLNIVREAFSKIGDPDALYGCGSSSFINSESRIVHYQQMENWRRVVESCDTRLSLNANSFVGIDDLTLAIGLCGSTYLQNRYVSSFDKLSPRMSDAFYESGWKLGIWDMNEPPNENKTFGYYQYAAVKDIHQNNLDSARININDARRSCVTSMAGVCFESTKNIYNILAKLQCLQDLEDLLTTSFDRMVEKWNELNCPRATLNFNHRKVVLYQRVRMADTRTDIGKNFVLDVAKQARKECDFNFAEACLTLIKAKKPTLTELFEMKVTLDEARILWKCGETYIARCLLKAVHNKSKSSDTTFHSMVLRTHGKLLSEINVESADTILDDYFIPASEMMPQGRFEDEKIRKNRLKTYKLVAVFADRQYQQISDYIKSDVFEEQKRSVVESKKQVDGMNPKSMQTDRDIRKTVAQLRNQSKVDDSLVKEMVNRENRYLILAVKYYLKTLVEGDEEDLKVFRIVSFWLHNKKHIELHRELRKHMSDVPSYKFVTVLPQLMAHITRKTAEVFGQTLNSLVETCIIEHPHHTLPLLLSLTNYNKCGSNKTVDTKPEERVLAADLLINRFRSKNGVDKIIEQMKNLFEAYNELAYYNGGNSLSSTTIPAKCRILKINDLQNIMCPTMNLPVNKSSSYDNGIVGIVKFETKLNIMGGINAPKKIACVCTDGVKRYQLVKGNDDMRVDAVMQQVFSIMNVLLLENKRASKRQLLIRTYKVVPMSQRSGVLEWCSNTTSLGDYLVGPAGTRNSSEGAHARYRPDDMECINARLKIQKTSSKSDDEKYKTYLDICCKLKPVFRYFFYEKFPSPTVWFERKLAYIHSLAVTSMVGYILGLGDRHVANMLIDEKTAEIIHIDFGVAFDQGMLLSTPELVPFRLTRDIEDGMGIFSIDGIFRRCCEQTLTVLRENSEIIETTIEVFIHDPLYHWKLTSQHKAINKNVAEEQNLPGESEVSLTASRALSRMKLKLQGLEEGSATSIEGQVNRLIHQAKDYKNLARIFHGWQPYL